MNYFKNKTQLEINNLIFVSEEFISKEQFFQIINMSYEVWSLIMFDLSLSASFKLTDPFETRNELINLFTHSFSLFLQSIL